MMSSLAARYFLAALLSTASIFAADASLDRPAKQTFEAEQLFGFLAAIAPLTVSGHWNDGLSPSTRWEKTMRDRGLSPIDGGWIIRDQTGQLRVDSFFLEEDTTFHFQFFPSDRTPLPAPILTALLTKAESSSLGDANTIELIFTETSQPSLRGLAVRKREYMAIRLQGGQLIRQTKHVTLATPAGSK